MLENSLKNYYRQKEQSIKVKRDAYHQSKVRESGLSSYFFSEKDAGDRKSARSGKAESREEPVANRRSQMSEPDLKLAIERLIKSINTTIAVNNKKREQIDFLRKERNLYDQVFRNLEYQILQQEKEVLDNMQRNKEILAKNAEMKVSLDNLIRNTEKSNDLDIDGFFHQEKVKYERSLKHRVNVSRKSVIKLKANRSLSQELIDLSDEHRLKSRNHPVDCEGLEEEDETNLNERRVDIIEALIKEFKYHNEENDIDLIMELYENGKELNDKLFVELSELQENVGLSGL